MSARMITFTVGADGNRLAINAEAVSEVKETRCGSATEIVMVTGSKMFVVAPFEQVLDKLRGDQMENEGEE